MKEIVGMQILRIYKKKQDNTPKVHFWLHLLWHISVIEMRMKGRWWVNSGEIEWEFKDSISSSIWCRRGSNWNGRDRVWLAILSPSRILLWYLIVVVYLWCWIQLLRQLNGWKNVRRKLRWLVTDILNFQIPWNLQ